jgi:hypothetical protein
VSDKKHSSTVRAVNDKLGNVNLISANVDDLIHTLQRLKDRFPQYESLLLCLPKHFNEVPLELYGFRDESESERHTRKFSKN